MVEVCFKKEVMERDVLNRIKWDKKLSSKVGDFLICYVEKEGDRLAEVSFNDLSIDGDFIIVDGDKIPMHRIREIKYKGRVVWNKRRI